MLGDAIDGWSSIVGAPYSRLTAAACAVGAFDADATAAASAVTAAAVDGENDHLTSLPSSKSHFIAPLHGRTDERTDIEDNGRRRRRRRGMSSSLQIQLQVAIRENFRPCIDSS